MRDFGTTDQVVINEFYVSIQGEGTRAGHPCAFVRLTGCGLRCTWCDSAYAFEGGERVSVDAVVSRVVETRVPLVLLTGGEPLEQPGCLPLATGLCDAGLTVLVETGGHVDTAPLDSRAVRILDVKCPKSGMAERNRWSNMAILRPQDEVKFVVADRGDFDFALGAIADHDLEAVGCAILFTPAHGALDPAELASWLLEGARGARLNLQLHKFIWPDRDSGI